MSSLPRLAILAGGLALLAAPAAACGQDGAGTADRDTAGAAARDTAGAADDSTGAVRREAGSYSIPGDSLAASAGRRLLEGDSLRVGGPEPFVYPLAGRRDPFRSPAAGAGEGPGLEALSLAGIIYAPETGSVAVIVNRTTGRRHRLRVGDRIAGARLVEVGPKRAVLQVTGYGGGRRMVLRLGDSQEEGLQS